MARAGARVPPSGPGRGTLPGCGQTNFPHPSDAGGNEEILTEREGCVPNDSTPTLSPPPHPTLSPPHPHPQRPHPPPPTPPTNKHRKHVTDTSQLHLSFPAILLVGIFVWPKLENKKYSLFDPLKHGKLCIYILLENLTFSKTQML